MPICKPASPSSRRCRMPIPMPPARSEEHTSELQSQSNLVCRLLLEKKKNSKRATHVSRNRPEHRDVANPHAGRTQLIRMHVMQIRDRPCGPVLVCNADALYITAKPP